MLLSTVKKLWQHAVLAYVDSEELANEVNAKLSFHRIYIAPAREIEVKTALELTHLVSFTGIEARTVLANFEDYIDIVDSFDKGLSGNDDEDFPPTSDQVVPENILR